MTYAWIINEGKHLFVLLYSMIYHNLRNVEILSAHLDNAWNLKWQVAGHQKSIAFLEILHATCQNCFVFYAPFKTAFRHPFYPLVSQKGRYMYIINEHGEAIGRKLAQGVPMWTLTLDL